MSNLLVPADGQGYLDFIVNNWGNTAEKEAVTLIVYKADS
jgi:hypothetical protein